MAGNGAVVALLAAFACVAALLYTQQTGTRGVLNIRRGIPTGLLSNDGANDVDVRKLASGLRRQVSAPERERAANFRRADESKNARRIHRAALSVRGREQELVEWDEDGAEKARCVGLLHACQSWLELKDGESNTISITAPDDSGKQLVDEKVVLPASGAANISDATWTVLQKACKYGLSDLSGCAKPSHWPKCTGSGCERKGRDVSD